MTEVAVIGFTGRRFAEPRGRPAQTTIVSGCLRCVITPTSAGRLDTYPAPQPICTWNGTRDESHPYHEPTGISGLVYEEAPDPTLVFGDVLIQVAACGITHNELDYPIWTCRAGHQRTSIIPGAEVSGGHRRAGIGHGRRRRG